MGAFIICLLLIGLLILICNLLTPKLIVVTKAAKLERRFNNYRQIIFLLEIEDN